MILKRILKIICLATIFYFYSVKAIFCIRLFLHSKSRGYAIFLIIVNIFFIISRDFSEVGSSYLSDKTNQEKRMARNNSNKVNTNRSHSGERNYEVGKNYSVKKDRDNLVDRKIKISYKNGLKGNTGLVSKTGYEKDTNAVVTIKENNGKKGSKLHGRDITILLHSQKKDMSEIIVDKLDVGR
jgi:hypothetical protein